MGEEHTKESDPNVKIYKEVEQSGLCVLSFPDPFHRLLFVADLVFTCPRRGAVWVEVDSILNEQLSLVLLEPNDARRLHFCALCRHESPENHIS